MGIITSSVHTADLYSLQMESLEHSTHLDQLLLLICQEQQHHQSVELSCFYNSPNLYENIQKQKELFSKNIKLLTRFLSMALSAAIYDYCNAMVGQLNSLSGIKFPKLFDRNEE